MYIYTQLLLTGDIISAFLTLDDWNTASELLVGIFRLPRERIRLP